MTKVSDVFALTNSALGQAITVNGPRLRGAERTQFRRYKQKLEALKRLLHEKYGERILLVEVPSDYLEPEAEALLEECLELQENLNSPIYEIISERISQR